MPPGDANTPRLAVGSPGPGEWDTFVGSITGDVFVQTTAWAQTKAPGQNHEVIGFYDRGRLVGGCMLLSRGIGPTRIAYAPRGPLVSPGYEGAAPQIIAELLQRARSRRPYAVVVQPTQDGTSIAQALDDAGFTAAPLDIAPGASVEIDLTREPDDILANMRSSRRRNIRKAERLGVEVRAGDRTDLDSFWELHAATAARQGFTPLTLDYLTRQWDVLAASGSMRVYFASLDGEALAAATVTTFGDRAVFKLAGLSEHPDARDARASEYLHWKVLCAAREDGYTFYDLGGFDRVAAEIIERGGEPPESLRTTASQFKLGFGGNVVTRPRAMWRLGPGVLRFSQRPLREAFERSRTLNGLLNTLRAG